MNCQVCNKVLPRHNRSGFCSQMCLPSNWHRNAKRRGLRLLKQKYCTECGYALRRLHPRSDLCARCYIKHRGHTYLREDVLRVLHEIQNDKCWWCGKHLSECDTEGHHIYPYTMMPDNNNADENCGAVHKKCHKEIRRNFTLETYALFVCYAG